MTARPRSAATLATAFALALVPLTLLALPAHAHRAPSRVALPLSARPSMTPDLAEDALGPVTREQGAVVQRGASGLLRRYWLREPAAAARAVAPRQVASEFLAARALALGLPADAPERELALDAVRESPSGTHVRWHQTVGGVPVWRSDLVVKVSRLGEVSSVQNNLTPGLVLDTQPSLDESKAVSAAVASMGPIGRAIGDFKASLAVLPLSSGARLVYVVSLPLEDPAGDWRVFVDARTGALVALEDAMVYATGTGRVFDPDPMTKMNDSSYVDNNDADSSVPFPAAYDIVTLNDITLSASTYSLTGPYVSLIDNESPTLAPVTASHPDSFRFQRSASGFEDVMCYFQLDKSQRYVQSLGFTNINNRVQEVDSHGLSGADNSHYVPSTKRLAFGEGGVDDDEDADVIWHEYGHSIQDDIVPGWGGGHEGAMGEGFGDYWAASYSLSINPTFQPGRVFTWDGNGETWTGRKLIDTALHYPANCCGEVHDSGTLWCSALMDCWWRLGRSVMDRLVLDHHFALGTSATMADAAQQIIQSDIDLFGGAHLSVLVARFGYWGMVDPAAFAPVITHTPLTDTEDTTGPYAVVATITSTQPLAPATLAVEWGVGAFTGTVALVATATPNQYQALIPGPLSNVDVRYYLHASDTNGGTTTHPAGAPASFHTFHVGADLVPPVLTHTPLGDTPALGWPRAVSATVTDNRGVDPSSVQVAWTLNAVTQTPFALTRVGTTDVYSGTFPALPAVVAGDAITYHLTAQDVSLAHNVGRSPASGEHAFAITASLGTVLVLDDDEVAAKEEPKVLKEDAGAATVARAVVPDGALGVDAVLSANDIASILNALGYVATVEPAATSNPATWPGYSFLVSASGANTAPVASSTYRAALEAHVAAGRKLLVEGGEVVYDAASSPGYPTFKANVLHVASWSSDNGGNLTRLAAQATHPLATTPNALPATLAMTYTGIGSEDSYVAVAPAYIVYGVTAQAGNGGILVYDPTPPPQAGQIVVFGFNLKQLGDATLRSQLVANAAAYLTAAEGAADGGIRGRVYVDTNPDRSGALVTVSPGGASATTDVAGEYHLSGLYAGTYTLTFTKAGHRTETRSVTVPQSQVAECPNVILYLVPVENACLSPALAIPDNSAAGASSVATVASTFAVASVNVDVNLTHTYIGDLIVELRHGAKTVRLHNRSGGGTDNLAGNYPGTLTVGGPGALADFAGDAANGAWTLFVSDNASADTGSLVSWCLHVSGVADTSIVVAVDGAVAPASLRLAPARPNPSRGDGATLRFALPRPGPVALGLYDVSGRLVRTLFAGDVPAGERAVRWDGRDERGHAAPAGVYLARLRALGEERVTRLVVMP
jgi:zinc metalloprotease ZmpB